MTYYAHSNTYKHEFSLDIYIHYNSRILVDEDGLGGRTKKIVLLLKQFHENVHSKHPGCRKLSDSSERQNDDLMHPWGLKG